MFIASLQEVRYLFSKMGYAKGWLSRIYMVVDTTLLLQCILFLINPIVLSSSTLALILNAFLTTLVSVLCLVPWLKFLIMGLTAELKMAFPMRRNISEQEHFSTLTVECMQSREIILSWEHSIVLWLLYIETNKWIGIFWRFEFSRKDSDCECESIYESIDLFLCFLDDFF